MGIQPLPAQGARSTSTPERLSGTAVANKLASSAPAFSREFRRDADGAAALVGARFALPFRRPTGSGAGGSQPSVTIALQAATHDVPAAKAGSWCEAARARVRRRHLRRPWTCPQASGRCQSQLDAAALNIALSDSRGILAWTRPAIGTRSATRLEASMQALRESSLGRRQHAGGPPTRTPEPIA